MAFCSCCDVNQIRVSDGDGIVEFEFDQIGGRGELDIMLESLCGEATLPTQTVTFTSPDLAGNCSPEPQAVDVVDMGIWAGGLGTYLQASDYNCDGTVDVIDLGLWASGLGSGCGPPCE